MSEADDLMKGASKLFGKLGGALRQAGSQVKDTAKQVTGLGRGDVKLEIPQPRAHPGGTISGKVILALPEPVEAKRLIVTLRARQKVATISNSGGTKPVGTSHADVYQFDRELSGAQKYTSGEHAFELVVPPDALDLRPSSAGANPLADAVRTAARHPLERGLAGLSEAGARRRAGRRRPPVASMARCDHAWQDSQRRRLDPRCHRDPRRLGPDEAARAETPVAALLGSTPAASRVSSRAHGGRRSDRPGHHRPPCRSHPARRTRELGRLLRATRDTRSEAPHRRGRLRRVPGRGRTRVAPTFPR